LCNLANISKQSTFSGDNELITDIEYPNLNFDNGSLVSRIDFCSSEKAINQRKMVGNVLGLDGTWGNSLNTNCIDSIDAGGRRNTSCSSKSDVSDAGIGDDSSKVGSSNGMSDFRRKRSRVILRKCDKRSNNRICQKTPLTESKRPPVFSNCGSDWIEMFSFKAS